MHSSEFTHQSSALAAYEYVITFQQEVSMLWRRRWSAVTWLFVLNRYLLMIVTVCTVVPTSAQVSIYTHQ